MTLALRRGVLPKRRQRLGRAAHLRWLSVCTSASRLTWRRLPLWPRSLLDQLLALHQGRIGRSAASVTARCRPTLTHTHTDRDGNGFITAEELKQYFIEFIVEGEELTDEEGDGEFRRADAD